ncbi:MAG: carbonic anhydrase [Chloroflexi bacterium]|nr:MAG: carbonic anhydrase [Chloroflexota bacterium]
MNGTVTTEDAFERLLAGNRRFVDGRRTYPNQSAAYRQELVSGQHPFAAVLGCADSRIPPEIIFDQGLGDIFTVRVAGNIVDDASLGSLEYAVEHLGVQLIIVLGHSGCGAVQAAFAGGHEEGRIASLIGAIQPAVEQSKREPCSTQEQALVNAVRKNVDIVVQRLCTAAPIIAPCVNECRVKIIGAYYDQACGMVEFFL